MTTADNTGHQFEELKSSLITLISAYREAHRLIGDQLQAVIYSDIVWLNSLVEEQLAKYEMLEKMEADFKNKLEGIFKDYCPEENKYSLTLLLKKLGKPSKELNKLRSELHAQVTKTQELRDQLMELLQFASTYNAETFQEIFQLESDETGSYGADGRKKEGAVGSIAINQKA